MIDSLRASQTRNICHVFIRNLDISAQIGIHGHEQRASSQCP
jgi:hypothetical protein